MQAPVQITHNNRERWNYSQTRMIEYVLWKNENSMSVPDIKERLSQKYGMEVRETNIHALLRPLLQRGDVVKLMRGIYLHADHCGLFD